MKQSIRFKTFETNSSSMHSLTILSIDEFNKFKAGQYCIDWNDELISRGEAMSKMFSTEEKYQDFLQEYVDYNGYTNIQECMTSEEFTEEQLKSEVFDFACREYGDYYDYAHYVGEECEYETFEQHYTTKSGDEIVVFGYYGR